MLSETTLTYRCDDCGQGWQFSKTDEFNKLPVKHCPICGTPRLRKAKSIIGTQDAKCFEPFGEHLAMLLYQEWRIFAQKVNPVVSLQPRFIDFAIWYMEQPETNEA